MITDKKELVELWKKMFNQLHETSAYVELFACSHLCRSHNHIDKKTADRNLEIQKKYKSFFVPLEHGIAYALTLSLTKLFESKKRLSLQYLISEAEKFKIVRTAEFNKLKETHKHTLEKVKNARDNFFAHRHKNFEKIGIPSSNDLFSLLNDTAAFLNSIGSGFENGGHSYSWNEGFAEETRKDFQLVLDNLYRGENSRLTNIEVEYSGKL